MALNPLHSSCREPCNELLQHYQFENSLGVLPLSLHSPPTGVLELLRKDKQVASAHTKSSTKASGSSMEDIISVGAAATGVAGYNTSGAPVSSQPAPAQLPRMTAIVHSSGRVGPDVFGGGWYLTNSVSGEVSMMASVTFSLGFGTTIGPCRVWVGKRTQAGCFRHRFMLLFICFPVPFQKPSKKCTKKCHRFHSLFHFLFCCLWQLRKAQRNINK